MLCSSQGKPCPECNRLGDALRKRAERHINSKKLKPSVVPKLQMMTVNQLLAKLKTVQRENKNLTRQVIRLTKRLKVMLCHITFKFTIAVKSKTINTL